MGGTESRPSASSQASLQVQLAEAGKRGDAAAIRALIAAGAQPCVATSEGRTPLHFAADRAGAHADAAALEALLSAESVNVDVTDEQGYTPLLSMLRGAWEMALASTDRLVAALKVIAGAGANVNARTRRGETPLHFGAFLDVAVVEALLALGARTNVPDDSGCNALAYAAHRQRVGAVQLLLAAGESPNTIARPWPGALTPTSLLVRALLSPSFSHGPVPYDFFGALLDAGADRTVLHHRDPVTGGTLLFHTVCAANRPLLRRLTALGVDVNARDRTGRTALFLFYTTLEHLRNFVEAGVDVNAQDNEGQTVLHLLALKRVPNPAPHIEILLNAGIDPSIRRNDGLTAVDLARQSDQRGFCAGFKCVKLR